VSATGVSVDLTADDLLDAKGAGKIRAGWLVAWWPKPTTGGGMGRTVYCATCHRARVGALDGARRKWRRT